MKKLNINDKVRYIYPNYHLALKEDYTQPYNWKKPKENIKSIMIGGEYTIVGIKKICFFFPLYQLSECLMWSDSRCLIKSELIKLTTFKIGECVRYKPKCSRKEIDNIKYSNPNLIIDQIYKIVKIINDFYVILDVPYPDEWKKIYSYDIIPEETRELIKKYPNMDININEIPNESIPIRWIDLEKVD